MKKMHSSMKEEKYDIHERKYAFFFTPMLFLSFINREITIVL